ERAARAPAREKEPEPGPRRLVGVERPEKRDDAEKHGEQSESNDPSRAHVREETRDADRRDQQGDRERQEPDACLDRREAERDREEERDDEEHARLDEVLEEEHAQPA